MKAAAPRARHDTGCHRRGRRGRRRTRLGRHLRRRERGDDRPGGGERHRRRPGRGRRPDGARAGRAGAGQPPRGAAPGSPAAKRAHAASTISSGRRSSCRRGTAQPALGARLQPPPAVADAANQRSTIDSARSMSPPRMAWTTAPSGHRARRTTAGAAGGSRLPCRVSALQLGLQELGEQVVEAVPLPAVVERDDERGSCRCSSSKSWADPWRCRTSSQSSPETRSRHEASIRNDATSASTAQQLLAEVVDEVSVIAGDLVDDAARLAPRACRARARRGTMPPASPRSARRAWRSRLGGVDAELRRSVAASRLVERQVAGPISTRRRWTRSRPSGSGSATRPPSTMRRPGRQLGDEHRQHIDASRLTSPWTSSRTRTNGCRRAANMAPNRWSAGEPMVGDAPTGHDTTRGSTGSMSSIASAT